MRLIDSLIRAIYEKHIDGSSQVEQERAREREQQVPTLLQRLITGKTHRDLPETVDKPMSESFLGRLMENVANAFARRLASSRLNAEDPNKTRARSQEEARERDDEYIKSYNERMRENQSFGDQMAGRYDDSKIGDLSGEERQKRVEEERTLRGKEAQRKATEQITGGFGRLQRGVGKVLGVFSRFAMGIAKVAAVFKITEAVLKRRQQANFEGAEYSAVLTNLQAEDNLREEYRRAERARNRETSSRYFSEQYNALQDDLQAPKSALENLGNYVMGGMMQAGRALGPELIKQIPGGKQLTDLLGVAKEIDGKMPKPMSHATRVHRELRESLENGTMEIQRQAMERSRRVGPGS